MVIVTTMPLKSSKTELAVTVVTWLAYGWPVQAIVAALRVS
jgi:hypothetical protein